MKTKFWILFTPVFLLISSLGLPPAQAQGEKPYVSETGQFSIWLPTRPVVTQSTETTALGAPGMNTYTSDHKGIYSVELSILPTITASLGSHAAIYKKAVADFLGRTGASQESLTTITVQDHPAKQLVFKTMDGGPGTARFILVGRRFYVLNATSPYGSWVRRFLASFKIL